MPSPGTWDTLPAGLFLSRHSIHGKFLMLTRRRFLAASAATVTTVTAAWPKIAFARETGDIVLGIQSYTFRQFKLEPALQRIQKLGLKQAEFYHDHIPLSSTPAQLQAILKLCNEYEVKPLSFGVERFTKDHDKNKKLFDFGKTLGVKTLSADPEPDSFDSLDKLCDEYKIAIAIHPHGPVGGNKIHRWYSADVILKAVKDHHPLIGSCLDTGHLIRSAQLGYHLDPAEEVRKMGARNFGMHLKDHDNARKTDVILGQGVLKVAEVFKALHDVKFKGMACIEYEAKPEDPSADVRACLEVIKEQVKL
jgi:inosose dehydratase